MDAKSCGVPRGGSSTAVFIYVFWKTAAMRQSIMQVLSADRRAEVVSSLLLALYMTPKWAQVWSGDKILIMWFGAVDTESMQKQSESLVGDSQSH